MVMVSQVEACQNSSNGILKICTVYCTLTIPQQSCQNFFSGKGIILKDYSVALNCTLLK